MPEAGGSGPVHWDDPEGWDFLTRHDEDLREPLVRRQGSQVSMRMARGFKLKIYFYILKSKQF